MAPPTWVAKHKLFSNRHSIIHIQSTKIKSVQFNPAQFNSVQLNSIQFSSVQLNSIQFNSIQFNSTQFNSTQVNPTQLNSTQLNPIHSGQIEFLFLFSLNVVANFMSSMNPNNSCVDDPLKQRARSSAANMFRADDPQQTQCYQLLKES